MGSKSTIVFLRTRHSEGGPGQGEGGNPSSDYAAATIASFVAIVLLVAAGFACVWQRRKRKGFVPRKYETMCIEGKIT